MLREIDPPWPEGAVAITVWRNPLDPTDCITYAGKPGKTLISWLQRNYPVGFGRPIHILWNGQPHDVEYADRVMQAGDVLGLYVTPAGQAIAPIIVTAIITALVSAAITIALNLIFGKPKSPGAPPKPDPVYSLSGAPNSARLGDPVPAIYGKVITVPDWASQPYTFYQGNEQYLDELLVIGQGRYQIDALMVGDTPVSSLGDPGAVSYTIWNGAQHLQAMGTIEAATGIMENVITSPEVANQELTGLVGGGAAIYLLVTLTATAPSTFHITSGAPASLPGPTFGVVDYVGDSTANPNYLKPFTVSSYNPATGTLAVVENTVANDARNVQQFLYFQMANPEIDAGPFVVGKPGVRGNRVMLDFVFPQGLYKLSNDGKLLPQSISLTVLIQPIDDAGANAGSPITHSETITRAENTPQRLTFTYDVPNGRYSVKVSRVNPAPSSTQVVDAFTWTALKFRLINATGPVYGDATLIAVRIRATNGIGPEASSRVRVACTRLLPPLGSGTLAATRDPADAFVDVLTNLAYGARRPLGEVDIAKLTALKAHWAGRAKFDGIFNSKGTVWEALGLILQPAGALPYPDGNLMSAVQDGEKALRTQFFSDANMMRDTLQIGYEFDKPGSYAGYSVEYRDPGTFAAMTAIYPPGAVDLEKATLFGCTDQTTAEQYARLLWQRRLYQRKTATFTTELEGMIPRFTDRVAIASRLPSWGQTGVIAAVSGLAILVDQPLDWSGSGHVMILRSERGEPSSLITVTRGSEDNEAILSLDPGFLSAGFGQEPTHYSFGTATQVVRDFTIGRINPSGGVATEISATIYDPQVFAGTLPWLSEPI